MALPVYAGSGAYLEGSGPVATLTAPAGVVADDVVVATVYLNAAATTFSGLPGDWVDAPGSPVIGNDHRQHVLWHRATGPEAGPYAFPMTADTFRAGAAHRFTGCKATGTPWDVAAAALASVDSINAPAVSITTAVADELVVWTATCWSGGPWTPPAGFTERLDAGSFHHLPMATKDQSVAGTTGSVVGVGTNSNRDTAWLSALLPATDVPIGSGPMNLADVMDEIAAKLEPTGLRVWPYPPGAVTPPAAIVSYPEGIAFDLTYGRGSDRWTLPVVLVTGKATDRMTRETLSQHTDVAGVRSMKLAIETGPYVAFDHVRVTSCEFDVVTLGGVDYMAAIFDLDIVGPGV